MVNLLSVFYMQWNYLISLSDCISELDCSHKNNLFIKHIDRQVIYYKVLYFIYYKMQF